MRAQAIGIGVLLVVGSRTSSAQSITRVSDVVNNPGADDQEVGTPSISPDGNWITFEYFVQQGGLAFSTSIVRYDVAHATFSNVASVPGPVGLAPFAGNTRTAFLTTYTTPDSIVLSGVGLISVSTSGGLAGTSSSDFGVPVLSRDERIVAFASNATDLVANDTNNVHDIFVRDWNAGITELVSVNTSGAQADGPSHRPSLSQDGRFVAFDSEASNLDTAGAPGLYDVFVRDRLLGTTECVSVDINGSPANGASYQSVISADGRYVAFVSDASNLVLADTNGVADIFVRDRLAHVTRRVSVGAGGQANGWSSSPSISGDGRFVTFTSTATNLGPMNGALNVYVRDRTWSLTELVSVAPSPTSSSIGPTSISDDGIRVVYGVGNDPNSGGILLRDRGPTLNHAYCTGDGAGFPCPCGNQSASGSGAGCRNSLGTGALLGISGAASLSADTLVLHGSGMPDSSALFIQGSAPQAGGAGTPFGDGFRCVGGQIVRLGPEQNVAGTSAYPSGSDAQISVQGHVVATGSRFYQVWYRNADPNFCTSDMFNLSNGVELIWSP